MFFQMLFVLFCGSCFASEQVLEEACVVKVREERLDNRWFVMERFVIEPFDYVSKCVSSLWAKKEILVGGMTVAAIEYAVPNSVGVFGALAMGSVILGGGAQIFCQKFAELCPYACVYNAG